MTTREFDSCSRQSAAANSRRTTLLTLGSAALAAIAVGANPSAGAAKKKTGDTCGKKAKQRCSADAAACRASLQAYCEDTVSPTACVAGISPCCDECSANGFITCYVAAISA